MELKDKVAIVTGGSEGIGLGISKRLASEGAIVYLIARDEEKLRKAINNIHSTHPVKYRVGDITNLTKMQEIIDEVFDEEKRLDFFVNNAGSYVPYKFDTPIEVYNEVINLLANSPLRITDYLIKRFRDKSPLHILTMCSQASLKIMPNDFAYGTAKKTLMAGLIGLESQIKYEKIPNITLSRLYPGTVGTEKTMDLVKRGTLQDPISLDVVVEKAFELLTQKHADINDILLEYHPEGTTVTYLQLDSNGRLSPFIQAYKQPELIRNKQL